jgi:predicted NBD/HSP70 family sugar kinase
MADVERGIVLAAPNIFGDRTDIPLRDMLQKATGRPALIEMDAYAAALGESWRGVGQGVDYFVYMVIGTGVGAGILVEGRVFRGWHGTAGELGHTTIDPNGPPCNCGRHGCLEALVAGPAIRLRAQGALRQGRPSIIPAMAGDDDITPRTVFQAARQGDAVALDVVHKTVEYLGLGLINIIHLLNPRVVALGGGVATGGADLILDPLREEVARRCGSWVDIEGTSVVLAALGEDAPLLGVGRLVWDQYADGPRPDRTRAGNRDRVTA